MFSNLLGHKRPACGNNFLKPTNRATKFAEYVLANYGGMMGPSQNSIKLKLECNYLIKKCARVNGSHYSERIYLLKIAGDRLATNTPYETDLKITCYLYAGASSRDKVIQYLPNYLNSGELWLENHRDADGYRSYLMYQLANVYEAKKQYYLALELFEVLYEIKPMFIAYVVGVIRLLNKLCLFDDSLNFIRAQKRTTWYKMTDEEYRDMVELQDLERWKDNFRALGTDEDLIAELVKPIYPKVEAKNIFRIQLDWAALATGSKIVSARDRADYEWIKENLPDICPKSFSGYKRMKNQITKNFIKLSAACLEHGKVIAVRDEYAEQDMLWQDVLQSSHLAPTSRS